MDVGRGRQTQAILPKTKGSGIMVSDFLGGSKKIGYHYHSVFRNRLKINQTGLQGERQNSSRRTSSHHRDNTSSGWFDCDKHIGPTYHPSSRAPTQTIRMSRACAWSRRRENLCTHVATETSHEQKVRGIWALLTQKEFDPWGTVLTLT